jgi:hypothetical protein
VAINIIINIITKRNKSLAHLNVDLAITGSLLLIHMVMPAGPMPTHKCSVCVSAHMVHGSTYSGMSEGEGAVRPRSFDPALTLRRRQTKSLRLRTSSPPISSPTSLCGRLCPPALPSVHNLHVAPPSLDTVNAQVRAFVACCAA